MTVSRRTETGYYSPYFRRIGDAGVTTVPYSVILADVHLKIHAMKSFTLTLLLFCNFCTCVSAQAYYPMLDTGHVWIYTENQDGDVPAVTGGFALTVGPDTTINNVTYRQLLRRELAGTMDCPPEQRPCFELERPFRGVGTTRPYAFMREDTAARKVWRYNTSEDDRYPAEFLVFDFSLTEGDTLSETARDFHCNGFFDADSCGVVTRTDGDLSLDNQPYLRINHYGTVTRVGLPVFEEVSYTAVRGYPALGILTLPEELVNLVEFCRVSAEECLQLVAIRPVEVDFPFTVFPNPTDGRIQVTAPLTVISLTYFDALGRVVPDLTRQPAGVYMVRVDFGGGRFGVRRVVRR